MKTYKSNIDELKLKRVVSDFPRAQLSSSQLSADYARQFFYDDISIYESFFLILLNRANNTIGFVKISQGGLVATVVDVRLISKFAIESLATSVIVVHNHPSGNNNPSEDDKNITGRIKDCLKIFDITLLDHIILTEKQHFSFADNGLV